MSQFKGARLAEGGREHCAMALKLFGPESGDIFGRMLLLQKLTFIESFPCAMFYILNSIHSHNIIK
jgi:hypothetical protein